MSRPTRRLYQRTSCLLAGVLVALLLFGAATPASAVTFTFRVRGFGHGLGMSQYGAEGFARHGYSYDRILRHYYGNAGSDPKTTVSLLSSEPVRDVLLDRTAGSGGAAFTRSVWTVRPGYPGNTLTIYQGGSATTLADGFTTIAASGSTLLVTDPQGIVRSYTGTIAIWGSGTSPRLTQVKEATGHYNHEYVRYRGELRLTASAGKIKLVNRVSMRDYLYGVVPRESPTWFHVEALKAQAVAARGYSITSTRTELFTDTRDQVYGGHSRGIDRTRTTAHEDARTNSAVDATARRVVMYDGTPVTTYFMSTSGGHTESSENVWSTTLPHIRGVPDPYEVTVPGAVYHSWAEYEHDAATVRSRLVSAGIASSRLPAAIADIRVTKRGVSGRVMEVLVRGADGSTVTFSGSADMDRFRRAVGSRPPAYTVSDRWWYVNPKTGARIAGSDRYATSVAASTRVFVAPRDVIVAGGRSPADALAAAGLAGAVGGAPILLTEPGRLTPVVEQEIRRLTPSRVYVVGGTGAVSDAVLMSLRSLPGLSGPSSVTRLGGADRYETMRLIAEEMKAQAGPSPRAVVVNGHTLADAVAAAGLAYAKKLPVVLVKPNTLPAESRAVLDSHGVSECLVIGGTGVVGDAVLAGVSGGVRVAAGANRYETAALLADYVVQNEGFNWGSVYVSSGSSMVDALSAGPVAGHNMNPLLFVRSWSRERATYDRLAGLAARRAAVSRVHIVGGEGVIPGWQQGQIDALFD